MVTGTAAALRLSGDLGLALVALGAVAFGARPLFARLVFADGVDPALAGFLTLAPTALLCLPATLVCVRRATAPAARRALLWALLAGAFVAAGSLAYMAALEALPVATATLIYFSYPLFVVLLGWVLVGTRPSGRMLGAVILILVGCLAIAAPRLAVSGDLRALALCFVAPLSYAALILLLARRLLPLPLLPRIGLITFAASVVLLPAIGSGGFEVMLDLGPDGWVGVTGLVLLCGFVPQLATTIGVQVAGAERAAIAGVLELITALAIGWLMLQEPAALLEISGALAICCAVLLARHRPR